MSRKTIISPLTGKTAVLENNIATEEIINAYREELDLDVKNYFSGINTISIYRDSATDYRFYYPLTVAGDEAFYQKLQTFPWYYMEEKWEYDAVIPYIKNNYKVLEIGCGNGQFLSKLKANGLSGIGLELNKNSIAKANKNGLNVLNETIEQYAKKNTKYDVVCSFQVLEHIAEPGKFLQASLDCLKPGGLLIISVPNNNSFLKNYPLLPTNLPPHHMGLWDKNSLSLLGKIFGLTLGKIKQEPLQLYHLDMYLLARLRMIGLSVETTGRFGRTWPYRIIRKIAEWLRLILKGHTITAFYHKN